MLQSLTRLRGLGWVTWHSLVGGESKEGASAAGPAVQVQGCVARHVCEGLVGCVAQRERAKEERLCYAVRYKRDRKKHAGGAFSRTSGHYVRGLHGFHPPRAAVPVDPGAVSSPLDLHVRGSAKSFAIDLTHENTFARQNTLVTHVRQNTFLYILRVFILNTLM